MNHLLDYSSSKIMSKILNNKIAFILVSFLKFSQ